jgi:hypothetical protein
MVFLMPLSNSYPLCVTTQSVLPNWTWPPYFCYLHEGVIFSIPGMMWPACIEGRSCGMSRVHLCDDCSHVPSGSVGLMGVTLFAFDGCCFDQIVL